MTIDEWHEADTILRVQALLRPNREVERHHEEADILFVVKQHISGVAKDVRNHLGVLFVLKQLHVVVGVVGQLIALGPPILHKFLCVDRQSTV